MWKAHDIAKKQHRERAQPSARRKWGLLEKKKDYKLRAEDFHRKEAHLKLLRSKAAQANEDEFNFGMIHSKTRDGIRVAERAGAQALSTDAVKLLKTQDAGYVRSILANEQAQIKRARENILLPGAGKHTLFVQSERELKNFDAAKHFDTDKALLSRRHNRLRSSQLDEAEASLRLDSEAVSDIGDLEKLEKRIDRAHEFDKVQQELNLQRELMKKGERKKIVKDGVVTYKWKNVRKR